MLNFIPFTSEDFDAYIKLQNEEYANDLILIKEMTFNEALEYSQKEMTKFIPEGHQTKGHTFLNIIHQNEKIGVLWYWTMEGKTAPSIFLCHLYLYEKFRGQGFGKKALTFLENESQKLGARELMLHVFGHNKNAIKLYEKFGFSPWSIQMKKPLLKA